LVVIIFKSAGAAISSGDREAPEVGKMVVFMVSGSQSEIQSEILEAEPIFEQILEEESPASEKHWYALQASGRISKYFARKRKPKLAVILDRENGRIRLHYLRQKVVVNDLVEPLVRCLRILKAYAHLMSLGVEWGVV